MKYDYATNIASPTAVQLLNECKTFNLLNDTAIPSFRYSLLENFWSLNLEYASKAIRNITRSAARVLLGLTVSPSTAKQN